MNITPNFYNSPISKNIFRQHSGIEISEENIDTIRFVRSILRTQEGKINNNIINELFDGLLKLNNNLYIEYYGHPSTMIVNNTSIVIASQIFEREYSLNRDKYENVNTYANYFKTKKTHSDKITWLGSPSIVYSYKNRKILKNFLNQHLVINLFFWITSFNSTTCIKDFSQERSVFYCDKYEHLKRYCSDAKKYKIHNTYVDWKHNFTLNESKFITNFETAINRVNEEDNSLRLFNDVINKDKKFYQRYNEVFTLFFPWDVEGIEIGNIPKTELQNFVNEYNVKKIDMINDFQSILSDTNKITAMNKLIKIILSNNGTKIQKHLESENLSYTFFLLTKYILLANCDIVKSIKKNYIIDESDLELINNMIIKIIEILHLPLKFFEYRLNGDEFTFQLVEVELNTRESDFVLFEQEKNNITNITHVYKSDKQLKNKYNVASRSVLANGTFGNITSKKKSKKASKITIKNYKN
jgi:hypothetical protein